MRCRLATIAALSFCLGASQGLAGDTFRYRLRTDPATLDWTAASTNFETHTLMNIMEGLVEIDRQLAPVPALADSWEVSKDGLTYTFHLRPGVKWSDGVGLKARDFVTSWRRLLAPGTKNDYASFLYPLENAEAYHKGSLKDFSKVGVRALDAAHLQVRLERVVPYFVTLLSFWVTFPQREDLIRKKGWDLPANLVTLGPYKVARWIRGKELDFERNPTYYGKPPAVEHVVAYIEPKDPVAREMFFKDKLDALLDVTAQDLVDFSPQSGRQLRQFDYLASVFLTFNVQAAPLGNIDLRRALAQAIDRGTLQATLKGGQLAADSIVPRGLAGYESAALPTSTEGARHSLFNAGYSSPNLVPPLTLLAMQGGGEPIAEYVRDRVREALELNVELKFVTPPEYVALRHSRQFQMLIWQWGADYPDASSFMDLFLSNNPVNQTGWKNASYDTLVKSAGGSLKVIERLKAYSEAQKLLLQEAAVVVPLYFPKITALVAPTVAELEINPLNYLFFKKIVLK